MPAMLAGEDGEVGLDAFGLVSPPPQPLTKKTSASHVVARIIVPPSMNQPQKAFHAGTNPAATPQCEASDADWAAAGPATHAESASMVAARRTVGRRSFPGFIESSLPTATTRM